jgi:3-phenylpropionate/cinnamic acid dioxygenase small subunit
MMAKAERLAQASELLYLEAHYLDQKEWSNWVELYSPDAVFWMPSWINESQTTSEPETELNLLYLNGRSHLEDRVYRLQTEDSFASVPCARTVHVVSNIRLIDFSDQHTALKANWMVHSYGLHGPLTRGGYYDYQLKVMDGVLKIVYKKVTLIDDKLIGPVDIFHV